MTTTLSPQNPAPTCSFPWSATRVKALWLSLSFFCSGLLFATDYYMATNGNDANPGTLSQPFATISKFDQVAQPGDVLYIRGGVYTMTETILTKSGTDGNPITIRNYPGEVPVLDGNRDNPTAGTNGLVLDDGIYSGVDGPKHDWVFDGLYMRNWKRGAMYFGDVNSSRSPEYISCYNILVQNCVIDYCGQLAIRFTHSDHIEIKNSVFSRTGWDLNYGSWSSNINFIENNGKDLKVSNCASFHAVDVSSYKTDGNGMIMDVHGWTKGQFDPAGVVENCLMFENGGAGIAWTNSNNATIRNNTLYENGKEPSYVHNGYGLVFCSAVTNNVVENNIVYQSSGTGFKDACGDKMLNAVFNNNLISGEPGYSNPKFKNPSGFDFTLKSDSPAIDAGKSAGAPSSSIGIDPKVFKEQTSNQPISWYHIVPDLDYIISKGGLANCFSPVSRPKGGGVDQGAFEFDGNPTSDPGDSNNDDGSITRFEAEDAALTGMNVATSLSGYSGSGYTEDMTSNGDQVSFTINSQGGSSSLKVGYASWGQQKNAIVINGVETSYDWPATNGNFQVLDVGQIQLNAGDNTITIKKEWGYIYPDYIEVEGSQASGGNGSGGNTGSTATTAKIQAEDGTLSGSGMSINTGVANYEGSGHVGTFTDNNDKVTVQFTNVVAGDYTVNVRYQTWNDQQNYLIVNGNSSDLSWPSTGSGWAIKSDTRTLIQGNNTIAIQKKYGYMEVDYIEIVPLSTSTNLTTSIYEPTISDTVIVFNNYEKGAISIQYLDESPCDAYIFDNGGNRMETFYMKTNGHYRFNLAPGMYILITEGATGSDSTKFIVY